MASPSGAQYVFYDNNPNGVRIALTPDGSDLPAPVPGATNIEIFTATPGQIAAGYQASAFAHGASAEGATVYGATSLRLLTGNVGVRSPNDFPIIPGNGNQTIVGAGGDSIVAVSSSSYASPGNTQILLGSDAATVIGAAGDTITASGGSNVIDARSGYLAVRIGSSGGSDTIYSGSSVTVRGGAADSTIVGAAGDLIDLAGSPGKTIINAVAGREVVRLGSGAATVIGGAGDAIFTGLSAAAYIDASAGSMAIRLESAAGAEVPKSWSFGFVFKYADNSSFYSGTVSDNGSLGYAAIADAGGILPVSDGSGQLKGTYYIQHAGTTALPTGAVTIDRYFSDRTGRTYAVDASGGTAGLRSEAGVMTLDGVALSLRDVEAALPTFVNPVFQMPGIHSAEPTAALTETYQQVFGRDPDSDGVSSFVPMLSGGTSLTDIRSIIAHSAEAKHDLDTLYQQVLGRPIDPTGTETYENMLAAGNTIANVRTIVAQSPEAQRALNGIYRQVLSRDVDNSGSETYTAALTHDLTLQDVRSVVGHSPEAQKNLARIYQEVHGRDIDSSGLRTFTDALAAGLTIDSVRSVISHSPEAQMHIEDIFELMLNRHPSTPELAEAQNRLARGDSLQHLQQTLATVGSIGGDTIVSGGNNMVTADLGSDKPVTIMGATGDIINLSGSNGTAVIDVASGNGSVTLGGGVSTVYGGPGDTIFAGTASAAQIFAGPGNMSVILGASGSDTVFSGTGDTVTGAAGGTGRATVFGAANDTIDLSGWAGRVLIDATAGNEAVRLGSGAATVLGAYGDHITAREGTSTIKLRSGEVRVELSANHGSATLLVDGSGGRDTVTGFTEHLDVIALSGHDTVLAVMNSARSSPDLANSTILRFENGHEMTLVGVTSLNPDLFR